jgi:hypothetical protein
MTSWGSDKELVERDAENEARLFDLLKEADDRVGRLHANRWNMALSAAIHQARCIIELRMPKENHHA